MSIEIITGTGRREKELVREKRKEKVKKEEKVKREEREKRIKSYKNLYHFCSYRLIFETVL